MVVREIVEIEGRSFIHHFSDEGFFIRKVGTDEIYEDALDVIEYDYEETDIPIVPPEQEDEQGNG